ncbi:MAG: hypothetical protein PHX68_02390, partial [Alphaproteobacteria bacterium]|nr:hypothetical protein [Alphaproteobacteria bacterium]
MKKCSLFLTTALALGLACPALSQTDGYSSRRILICRGKQCAASEYAMSRGFLLNKLAELMNRNIGRRAFLCEADPVSRACVMPGIHLAAQTGMTAVTLSIPDVLLVDAKYLNGATGLDMILDYNVKANKTFPKCQASPARLSVDSIDKVQIASGDFACPIVELGTASVNATFNVDYIDFDYGVLGVYYTLGVGEAVRGDRTGYALMRWTADLPQTAGALNLEATQPILVPVSQQPPEK